MTHVTLSANPTVSMKDYMEYFNCSDRTALRYRFSDRNEITKLNPRFDGRIRLSHWMQLNSDAPPALRQYVTIEANW
jgi:hypothetical protein